MTSLPPSFHPAVTAWFRRAYPAGPTPAQLAAWPDIAAGRNVLLVSPTGTGKTLAAFLVALDRILKTRLAGDLEPRLRVVYVSPLKALDNDIHRNLEEPRLGIRREVERLRGAPGAAGITAGVRTGDTPPRLRAEQRRRPPDVLITTPESLYLMLTAGSRRLFGGVTTVILDEVHAVAGTKRGAHLALTLERLEEAVREAGGPSPQRIALSATVAPPETVAAFAAGVGRTVIPRVVDAPKELDLKVLAPEDGFAREAGISAWDPALDALLSETAGRRTTLVFCNNRRQAERIAARLAERTGRPVPAHHGSLAREPREEIERALKTGLVPILVATGSLELGLDVGQIDLVVQVTSPKGVARALQRVGRSGHLVGQASRGRFLPLFLEDLLECAATVEGMRERAVEPTRPPEFPLDVLAQQIVAETVGRHAEGPPATAASLFALFRRAYPYRNLTRTLFHETLAMLSGKYPKERFAELAPKLVWDRATDRVSPLPAARLAALLDGGTIGDRGTFRAVRRDGKTLVGELDEEFVYETRTGDVFLLGSRAWRVVEVFHDRVVLEDAAGEPARMPFWRGEGIGRSPELGERVGRLKRAVAERLDDPALPELLADRYACDRNAAALIAGAVRRELLESGGLASDRRIVFETFPNDLGDPCLLVRSVFGRGVNLPWSLALASALREETGVDVATAVSDDGILLRAPRAERELPVERLSRLGAREAKERLLAELPNAPMFGARFRENAQRALLLPRARSGRRTPFWLQRLKAKDLLQTTRSLPDFPIVAETYRDCLRDLWAFDRLLQLLEDLAAGRVEAAVVPRKLPSPAAQGLLFSFTAQYMYEWDAPRAEKGLHALAMNRELLGEVLGEAGAAPLAPEAVAEARAEVSRLTPRRQARDAEELLLVFQELGDLTGDEARERCAGDGAAWLDALRRRGSLTTASFGGEPPGGRSFFLLAEEKGKYRAALCDREAPPLGEILLRYVSTRGPVTAAEVAERYGLPAVLVEETLERLRLDGSTVRGAFGRPGALAWAGARLAESIRRKTLVLLRREIRPVAAETFRALLASRQGIRIGSRFAGEGAAERAVALLRGLSLPVLAWETAILPARLAAPEPDALDVLSARGLLVWRVAGAADPRAASLAFFFRGEGATVLPAGSPELHSLTDGARALYEELAVRGASFLSDLARRGADRERTLKEREDALVELILAGLATGDGLEGLREILRRGRRSRAGTARRRALRPRPVWGRWSLLSAPPVAGEPLPAGERAEAWARILLSRWGVVSRETLAAEDPAAVRWPDVAPAFARMEMRGDVRRGEFVEGQGPIQYAEEETVEALRALKLVSEDDPSALAVAGGADPVLAGLVPPPARDEWVVLTSGRVLLRLTPAGALARGAPAAPPPGDRALRAGLQALQKLLLGTRDPVGRPRRLTVSTVDGRPAAGSGLGPLLEGLGFRRDLGMWVFRAL